jgi:hypothetical protein
MIRVLDLLSELRSLGALIEIPTEGVFVLDSEKKLIEFLRATDSHSVLAAITPSANLTGDNVDSLKDNDTTIIFILDDKSYRDPEEYFLKIDELQQKALIVRNAIVNQCYSCSRVFEYLNINSLSIQPESDIAGKMGWSINLEFKSPWM